MKNEGSSRRAATVDGCALALSMLLTAGGLAACGSGAEADPDVVAGAEQAIVRGSVTGLAGDAPSVQVALVWTYWDEADCETSTDASGNVGRACSGSSLVTTGTLERTTGGFVIEQAEAPPAFVHGYDTEVAEAYIALLPEGVTGADLAADPTLALGVSSEHMLVYVPETLASDTIEAQMVGGSGLGAGFHLVRVIEDGPQVEAVRDGSEILTSQRGELAEGEEVVIQLGLWQAPAMFL